MVYKTIVLGERVRPRHFLYLPPPPPPPPPLPLSPPTSPLPLSPSPSSPPPQHLTYLIAYNCHC